MNLSDFAVKRPVTTRMFVAGIILLGVISLSRLPQELFPSVEYPQITIATVYKGAAPEEVETLITKLIEESVGTVSGVKNLRSISKEALSLVMVEFNWGSNMDLSSMAVREKIDLIKERLPRGCNEPIVVKYNPFELPVMVLNITGEYTASELLQISRTNLKNELEKVEGVASCVLSGGTEKEIKVEVDQARLTASGLSMLDVVEAIKKSNLNYPAGTIEESFYEQLIRTVGEFTSVDEIKSVPVYIEETFDQTQEPYKKEAVSAIEEPAPTLSGQRQYRQKAQPARKLVFIKDIASIKEGLKEKNSISRYNGKDTISISIQKRAGANSVRVADHIKNKLKILKDSLPKGVRVYITYDQSLFIKQAVRGVSIAALQGGVLAFLVLLFFLRNIRSAVLVALAIPISVMAAFSAMYFKEVSLNMVSLGGLALGIGMLVDNAIVVIENIVRRQQKGERSAAAASCGAGEVSSAISSSTLTTIIVFLPMIFVGGVAGQLFKELAFTVIFSLSASLVVALTVIPSFAAKLKKEKSNPRKKSSSATKLFNSIEDFYARYLIDMLRARGVKILRKVVIVFVFAVVVMMFLNKEFMPAVDQGQFIVKFELVPGATLSTTDAITRKIEEYLLGLSSVQSVTVDIGSEKEAKSQDILQTMGEHQARIMVNLKPRRPLWALVDFAGNYRHKGSRQIVQELKNYVSKIDLGGAQIEYILQENALGAALVHNAPVLIQIKGFDLDYLHQLTLSIRDRLEKISGIYGVRDSLVLPYPENKIKIDKDKAALFGLSVSDIALAVQTAIEGKVASKFKSQGREIDIRVRLSEDDRQNIIQLRRLLLRAPSGESITLADVAILAGGRGPTEIVHENKERVATIWANLSKRSLNSAIAEIESDIISKLDLKQNYSVEFAGQTLQMRQSFKNLRFALILSLILVYMVMAAQFESFIQPLIIMLTVPLAIIGVVAALTITGTKISVMVFLGAIVLGGIVVNNGIVLIDYINKLRAGGLAKLEAVREAAKARMRPILMTTATTVLGLSPLALGLSEGAQMQKPLAITIIGGLLVSTFLSLVVIPILYNLSVGE